MTAASHEEDTETSRGSGRPGCTKPVNVVRGTRPRRNRIFRQPHLIKVKIETCPEGQR